MKLIKVDTKGFKSFADRTILNFDGGVVGIVGPNGSGKSNINDAIKWVLGEQSIKNLRGDSSDDVIFSGSTTSPAANEAEVSLTFDNSNQTINFPGKTVTITRVIKRGEGTNKYYINGNDARLKDIKEIAMESGIGKSSLAIISQGTISDIAEATPEQRRGIFEEAAGISKYKSRKKEALKKLSNTSEALDKLKAIINELERQLNPLRRQAEKARRYKVVKGKLKSIEVSVIVKDIDFFESKLIELKEKLEHVIEAKDSLSQNITSLETQIEEKSSYKLKIENEVINLSTKLQNINEKLNQIEVDNSRISERRRMIIDGEVKSSSKAKIEAMTDELKRLSDDVAKYQIWEEKSLSDIVYKRGAVSKIQTDLTKLNYQLDDRKRRITKWSTKLAILEDHDNNKTNLFKGVKHVVENKDLFPGYKGLISELINVDDNYKKAIEAILSSALQHIVVDTPETAVKAVNFLKNNNGGRATFIPITSIRPKGFIEEHEMIMGSLDGFVDRASALVQTTPDNQILSKFLLGNIIIASDINSAKNISSTFNNRYMVVTLGGDIIRVGGVISGGQAQRSSDLLGFKEKIEKLKKAIPLLKNEIIIESKKTSELSIAISEEQSIIAELNIETAKIREKRLLTESQLQNLKSNYEIQSKQKFVYKAKTEFLSEDTLNIEKNSVSTLLKAKRESIIGINNDLSQFTIQKTEFERTLRDILESSSKQMTEKAQAEFVLTSSKKRLAEEYGMTADAAKAEISEIGDINKARTMIVELREEIKEIGHVNLDSIEMFNEVNERYTKLKNSEEELFLAQQTIVSAIDEMDQIIISRLDQTVKGTNEEFKNVFIKMFGGGHAEIRYTDSNNLLETGIDVIAQPPGKTVRNLKLFSGGEKSMIAISLLFAILKAKPLPLCILDEVEAALDEANVIRFAEYLQQLKNQTQFIVITHRFGTMSRVDHLFGASMQNRGVTSFFTVKLEDARKYID